MERAPDLLSSREGYVGGIAMLGSERRMNSKRFFRVADAKGRRKLYEITSFEDSADCT
jgi:hypothetical protein